MGRWKRKRIFLLSSSVLQRGKKGGESISWDHERHFSHARGEHAPSSELKSKSWLLVLAWWKHPQPLPLPPTNLLLHVYIYSVGGRERVTSGWVLPQPCMNGGVLSITLTKAAAVSSSYPSWTHPYWSTPCSRLTRRCDHEFTHPKVELREKILWMSRWWKSQVVSHLTCKVIYLIWCNLYTL